MTENQKAILEKLLDEEMTLPELASELHMAHSNLRKILQNMVKAKYIKLEGSFYSIEMDYNPELSWNFKPLMKAWSLI